MPDEPESPLARVAAPIRGLAIVLGTVAAATVLGRMVHGNAATAGFVFLLVVLFAAVRYGLAVAVIASLAAAGCYNFFFLPPVGTFTIAEPANWVALATFLLTSVLVTRLVSRADQRAREAEARRSEIAALYDLSLDLFASTNRIGALGEAAGRALRTLGARGGRLTLLAEDGRGRAVQAIGADAAGSEIDTLVESVARRGEAVELPSEGGARDVHLPLVLGGRSVGVLSVLGTRADPTALASVGRLVALAVEREKFLAERTRMEALRESDALKTSLLRAVSHDLRTPVTAIRMGLEGLRKRARDEESRPELVAVSRETERLSHRIDNLLAMARLDAGTLSVHSEPVPPGDLFRAALDQLPLVLEGRRVNATVTPDAPDALADPVLTVEILVNLLENAARVSPPGEPLDLLAAADPFAADRLHLDVQDRGPGVPAGVRAGRGAGDTGTGLGLEICRGLARALGGAIALVDRPGGGTIARLELPAARMEP